MVRGLDCEADWIRSLWTLGCPEDGLALSTACRTLHSSARKADVQLSFTKDRRTTSAWAKLVRCLILRFPNTASLRFYLCNCPQDSIISLLQGMSGLEELVIYKCFALSGAFYRYLFLFFLLLKHVEI
jgi:hypothetical protein